ncbi:LysM peptidoglycan-binding domain-containing protein [Arthrobacter sp. zg-Y1110]|uniref:LysM peptidoglycan-binding domain-containing protein n=1 Tax=Arthrobacter sp. zg-Y1110 TaxID=2886932 RepID=UPI001D148091|nr:LysM peptidoglycan-binding domain-containing protein [Arthrobacter sp. zg-Y1110]MCC3292512.1 LysM peptidoglycan-binding domain-containing protein [Arthrobacter sp. zg-Y1110]UWX87056.1 LysM peptidoglycan-binding domain-containing protein [Arthrobacter sp. zg-Y1110]
MSSISPAARRASITTLAALAIAAVVGGAPAQAAEPAYTVVSGDTLSGIAATHGVSLSTIFSANGLDGSSIIYPGDRIVLGGEAKTSPAPSPATPAPASASSYTVVPGDTLGAIASRHGVSLSTIFSANGLNGSSIIYPGDRILLGGGTQAAPAPSPAAPAPAVQESASASTYTVAPGDTLGRIASRHGVSLSTIFSANNMNGSTVIYPGQVIKTAGEAPRTDDTFVPTPSVPAPVEEDVFVPGPDVEHLTGGYNDTASVQQLVIATADAMGVDRALALAIAEQESHFNQNSLSGAGAIGIMQVMPNSGIWASELVGRSLNLHSADENVAAGVAILYALQNSSSSLDEAIASYYQGQGSVQSIGMYDDTIAYVESVKARMATFQ